MPPSITVKKEPVDIAPIQHDDPDASDDETSRQDIKPKIDGLETIGIDFNPIRPVPKAGPRKPNEFTIKLLGTKDGQHFRIKLFMFPKYTGLVIKKHLVKYYGYEMDKLRIIYNGEILQNNQTMAELEVEDYDEFDVYLEQMIRPTRIC
ncbi:SUMO protein smt3 [Vanrija albida]|uniref:SUMO protein smt3 n=1 Tax=Vanrija albida TaxID=181172 RepID=A0ABR3Q424_9TREE